MGKYTAEELCNAQDEDRIIVLPVPIGTPVLMISSNQHDGPYISPVMFEVCMCAGWGNTYFATYKEAKAAEIKASQEFR